jgi:hypothetical protein
VDVLEAKNLCTVRAKSVEIAESDRHSRSAMRRNPLTRIIAHWAIRHLI